MKIFIVTEATQQTGMGHAARCCALGDAFEERGFSPAFVINGTELSRNYLSGRNYTCFDWTKETERLLSIINDSDIVIIDSYLADESIYEMVSQKTKTAVYLDDYIRIPYPKGIVVNGTILAEELTYPQNAEITYLLGKEYVMLRKEFWDVPEKIINDEVRKILVTIGGSDIKNLTSGITNIIACEFTDFEQYTVSKDKKLSATEMRSLMLDCDVAVSAAGQTINELARCGIPSVVFKVADNQTNNIAGWKKTGFIAGETSLETLAEDIKRLLPKDIRMQVSANGRRNIDGLGAQRIAKEALRQAFIVGIIVRDVSDSDLMPLYLLANDPVVRENSFNPEAIPLDVHKVWFGKIRDSAFLYIFEIGGEFAGYVRFDVKPSEIVTNIAICKKFRGYGLGDEFLRKALALNEFTKPVTAYIKSTNLASQKIFESAGYKKSEEGKWIIESS